MANKRHVDYLNNESPVTSDIALGTKLDALITLANETRADYLALLAKLDLDAGVTGTNYAATVGIGAPAVDVLK